MAANAPQVFWAIFDENNPAGFWNRSFFSTLDCQDCALEVLSIDRGIPGRVSTQAKKESIIHCHGYTCDKACCSDLCPAKNINGAPCLVTGKQGRGVLHGARSLLRASSGASGRPG